MSTASRPPLTRHRVLQGGVDLADEHGIGRLSMRKLAASLGFEVMSLYNHVASKNDLLEGMVELVATSIEDPPAGIEWRAGIHRVAGSTNRVLLSHPWAIDLWTTTFAGPSRFRSMENLLGYLRDGRLDGELGDLGFHAVNLHTVGFSQQQVAYRFGDDEWAALEGRFEREVDPVAYPLLVAHKAYHDRTDRGGRTTVPDEFAFVLDLLLDGLERVRDARLGPGPFTD